MTIFRRLSDWFDRLLQKRADALYDRARKQAEADFREAVSKSMQAKVRKLPSDPS